MADSTVDPLLPKCNPNVDVEENDQNQCYAPIIPSLNSTIEACIGEMGWAQLLQAILVSLSWFFEAQQTFLSVFTDAEPPWHCTDTTNSSSSSSSSPCGSSGGDVCVVPSESWSWDLPPHASIISEWGLQCFGSFVTGLPASSFFAGSLVGGFALSTLADSFLGRKNALLLGCLVMSISALLTAFSSDVWVYSALRFAAGFGRSTMGTTSLVLSTELVGKRWRGQVGVLGFLCFTLGFLSLPVMALASVGSGSSWRSLYLWTSIPAILYCIAFRAWVRESPRWLFGKGRKEDAVATLRSIANANANAHSADLDSLSMDQKIWNDTPDLFSTLKTMAGTPWALQRLSSVMAICLGVGLVYYGMPLSLGSLAFNLYLSVALNALSELPSSLVTLLVVGKMSRKDGILLFTAASGICSVASVISSGEWMQMGLELVSFFSACTAYNVLQIFTVELFPTCVRSSAMAMVRQAGMLGGVFGPVLAAAGRGGHETVSFGVFGLVIGCCGLFAVFLPETRGRPISDTMDEEEHRTSTPGLSP